MGGYEVKFAIESTSANNYKLSTDAFSINDYSISTFFIHGDIGRQKKPMTA